jgi:bifunctional NMN adenylyltransferase/nudix hydrolase
MTPLRKQHGAAVFVGRFQAFHNGQLALLRRALGAAPLCIVVLGSAFQARSPKNPFSWQERAEMIRLALPEADRERLRFLPVRDYYSEERWVAAVHRGVAAIAGDGSVVLVGHFKDATSQYLRAFPDWSLDDAGRQGDVDASGLRDAYFGAHADGSLDAALAALVDVAPGTTLQFLRAWAALPHYPVLAEEWESLRAEKAKWSSAPYPPVFVTVDAVIKCAGQVLLIERGRHPGKGLYALPGGFLEQRETVYQSALRELEEETSMQLLPEDMRHALKAVKVFDHPDRSQRGRVITHAHLFDLGSRRPPEVRASDDASAAEWVPVTQLAAMEARFHEDHFNILDFFLALTAD